MRVSPRADNAGTSLVEVTVALGLLIAIGASAAPVTTTALAVSERARLETVAAAAASSQLERLRAMPWYQLPDGAIVRDTASRFEAGDWLDGGPGLAASPGDTLETSGADYADVPDPIVDPAASPLRLIRRWLVAASPTDPDCVVMVVEVAAARTLADLRSMSHAATGRAQTLRCLGGARP